MKNARIPSKTPLSHSTVDGYDVVTSKVSDHHPVIHDEVFFWNMMMQGNTRGIGSGFNNGFGIIESDKEYKMRLALVAKVIAESVYRDSSIEVISLCEGPIKPEHVEVLFLSLIKYPFMARFMCMKKDMFHTPGAVGPNWGLLMLADTRYHNTLFLLKHDHTKTPFGSNCLF